MLKFIRVTGYINIIAAVILLICWCLIPVFVGTELMAQDFKGMVINPSWIPINTVFFCIGISISQ